MRQIASTMSQWKAETQEGTSLHFEKCKGGYFSNKEEYGLKVIGKTKQNNIPTLDEPQEIQCVKQGTIIKSEGKNLFNKAVGIVEGIKNETVVTSLWADPIMPDNYIKEILKPNTNYVLSFDVKCVQAVNQFSGRYFCGFAIYNSKKTEHLCYSYDKIKTSLKTGETAHVVAPIAPRDDLSEYKMIAYTMHNDTWDDYDKLEFYNIQITEGIIEEPYEPYCGNQIAVPCDLYEGDIWYPATGKVEKYNGVIKNYNYETITTNYYSTTGELSEGATIIYQLSNPLIEYYEPQLIIAPQGMATTRQIPIDLTSTLSATHLVKNMPQLNEVNFLSALSENIIDSNAEQITTI